MGSRPHVRVLTAPAPTPAPARPVRPHPFQVDGYMYDDSWYSDADTKLALAAEQRRSTTSTQMAKPESSNELLEAVNMLDDDVDSPSSPGNAGHG